MSRVADERRAAVQTAWVASGGQRMTASERAKMQKRIALSMGMTDRQVRNLVKDIPPERFTCETQMANDYRQLVSDGHTRTDALEILGERFGLSERRIRGKIGTPATSGLFVRTTRSTAIAKAFAQRVAVKRFHPIGESRRPTKAVVVDELAKEYHLPVDDVLLAIDDHLPRLVSTLYTRWTDAGIESAEAIGWIADSFSMTVAATKKLVADSLKSVN